MKTDNLPIDELKRFGIIMPDNTFSKKLSEDDIDKFLNGHTLHAENDSNKLTFQLRDNNSRLEVNLYENDRIAHKNLSTEEIIEALDSSVFYKTTADYGTVTGMGKESFNGNPDYPAEFFVELENERGKTKFYGADLQDDLRDYAIGDSVQISLEGMRKTELVIGNTGELYSVLSNKWKLEQHQNELNYERKAYVFNDKTQMIEELDLVKNIKEIRYIVEKQNNERASRKYLNELEKLKGFMQHKAVLYPEIAKSIINDVNIISKEISTVEGVSAVDIQQEKDLETKTKKTGIYMDVNDYDTYEDANRHREEKQEEKQNKGRGITR